MTPPPPAPRRISHYRLGDRLGAGGMGEVYRAWDLALGRPAAIKVLNFGYGAGGADETEALVDLALAAALGQGDRAFPWLDRARARAASPFRIREVEAALARRLP